MRNRFFLVLLLWLAAIECLAAPLELTHMWARATAPGARTAAVYGELHNTTGVPVIVGAVLTSVAARAEIHQTRMEGDVMKMEHMDRLVIHPGERVEFTPGAFHIMLTGLNVPLAEGDGFDLMFHLEGGAMVPARVTVGSMGQMQMPH